MNGATVFIVDDDQAVARSLRWLIEAVRLRVEIHASAREFLDGYDPARPGCLLLDLRMPGMSGLELQQRLSSRPGHHLPIIFITGHGDVQVAVRALRAGAFDFIEKPFNDQDLLERIHAAITHDRIERERHADRERVRVRMGMLTPREHEVFALVARGLSNKVIAGELGLSPKTVEGHRARVMEKMAARSLSDLVRMALCVDALGPEARDEDQG